MTVHRDIPLMAALGFFFAALALPMGALASCSRGEAMARAGTLSSAVSRNITFLWP